MSWNESDVDRHRLWEEHETTHRFYSDICFAPDGGFSEVGQLFSSDRWANAALSLVFLALNVQTVLVRNLGRLQAEKWTTSKDQPFLITNWLVDAVLPDSVYAKNLMPQKAVALFEVSLLGIYLSWVLCTVAGALCSCDHVRRWHSVSHFFWDELPSISTFSGLRLLGVVTPQMLLPAISAEFKGFRRRRRPRMHLACFILERVAAAIIGFDTFLVKFRSVCVAESVLVFVAFLNQVLGVVPVQRFTQHRLYIFIFGGEDGVLNSREEAVLQTWQAMLAQRMWRSYSCLRFLVMMLTFGDYDFQRLVLNECAKSKQGAQVNGLHIELTPRPGALEGESF